MQEKKEYAKVIKKKGIDKELQEEQRLIYSSRKLASKTARMLQILFKKRKEEISVLRRKKKGRKKG